MKPTSRKRTRSTMMSGEEETKGSGSSPTLGVADEFPQFNVDLDLPPERRWNPVIQAYKGKLAVVAKQVESHFLGDWFALAKTRPARMAQAALNGTMFVAKRWFEYQKEIESLAVGLEIPTSKMLILQLAYELCAGCTSIVVDSANGPILARNLDWPLALLKDFIIDVHFTRSGRPLFRATTFVGYAGVLTGMKPGAFSVSINFRSLMSPTGGAWDVAKTALKSLKAAVQSAWPVAFLLRRTLEDVDDYATAHAVLSNSKLIAPCYIIVAGIRRGEGACITRDRGGAVKGRTMELRDGPVVQTNIDHWDRDLLKDEGTDSLLRRELARQLISRMSPIDSQTDQLLWLLDQYPVGNEMTVYKATMCAATGEYYSASCPWFNDEFDIPTRCCHVPKVRGSYVSARRRRCKSRQARMVRPGFESYYCKRHNPLDEDLLQDQDDLLAAAAADKAKSGTSSASGAATAVRRPVAPPGPPAAMGSTTAQFAKGRKQRRVGGSVQAPAPTR